MAHSIKLCFPDVVTIEPHPILLVEKVAKVNGGNKYFFSGKLALGSSKRVHSQLGF